MEHRYLDTEVRGEGTAPVFAIDERRIQTSAEKDNPSLRTEVGVNDGGEFEWAGHLDDLAGGALAGSSRTGPDVSWEHTSRSHSLEPTVSSSAEIERRDTRGAALERAAARREALRAAALERAAARREAPLSQDT
jgi:hypothetical protein